MLRFRLPDVGEGVREATVTRILVQSGDEVTELQDPFIEALTDKAAVEIPAPVSGVVGEIFVKEGDTVEVGSRLATFYPRTEYRQVDYTIYMAVHNLRKLDVSALCSLDGFRMLAPDFDRLVQFATSLTGAFLTRLSEPLINRLQGTLYSMWRHIVRVRRFDFERPDVGSRQKQVVDSIKASLPVLLENALEVRGLIDNPRIFIGSSFASVRYADVLREQMGPAYRCTVWKDDDALGDPRTPITVDKLNVLLLNYDFAVFVLGGEHDQVAHPNNLQVRDLLVLAIGLFLSSLGKHRVGLIRSRGSTVLGAFNELTAAEFDPDADVTAEMTAASSRIRALLREGKSGSPLG